MSRIPIQGYPDGLRGIPSPNLLHEPADLIGAFVVVEGPAAAASIHFVDGKQIEPAAGLLPTLYDQSLGRRIAPAPIGFDSNELFIEKQQYPIGW